MARQRRSCTHRAAGEQVAAADDGTADDVAVVRAIERDAVDVGAAEPRTIGGASIGGRVTTACAGADAGAAVEGAGDDAAPQTVVEPSRWQQPTTTRLVSSVMPSTPMRPSSAPSMPTTAMGVERRWLPPPHQCQPRVHQRRGGRHTCRRRCHRASHRACRRRGRRRRWCRHACRATDHRRRQHASAPSVAGSLQRGSVGAAVRSDGSDAGRPTTQLYQSVEGAGDDNGCR